MKKELYVGSSHSEFIKICEALQRAEIRYKSKVAGNERWSASQAAGVIRADEFSQNPLDTQTYYVYVDGRDFDNAAYCIRQIHV